jgi:O-antigen ligase
MFTLTRTELSESPQRSGCALFIFLLLALSMNFLFASGHDSQRCVEVVAICAMATVALVRIGVNELPSLPKAGGILLLIFFALGLVSSLSAYSLRHAVYEWTCFLLLLVLVFSIATELAQDASRLPKLIHWVGIACALYSLRILVMYTAALASGYQPDWTVLAPGFSNPRFLNHALTPLFPLIVLLYLRAPKASGWRKAWFALIAFWWALLFVTEARATILALSIGCACAVMLRRSHARQFFVAMVCTALTSVIVYVLGFILLPLLFGLQPLSLPSHLLERTVANPISDRSYLWNLAKQLIAMHPWLGVGPLHFAHEGGTLYKAAHPHNWILQVAVEWGGPALLCLAGAISLGARALLRSGKKLAEADVPGQQMLVTLVTACAAIFVDGTVSGVLVMPQSQLSITLVLGIACAWVRVHGNAVLQHKSRHTRLWRLLAGVVVASGLCGFIWSVAPDFIRHAGDGALNPAERAANPQQHWPRMWEAGYF